MQPSLEIQQYGDFFEVVYRDGVDPGCFKFYGNAQQVHDDILFRIGKL